MFSQGYGTLSLVFVGGRTTIAPAGADGAAVAADECSVLVRAGSAADGSHSGLNRGGTIVGGTMAAARARLGASPVSSFSLVHGLVRLPQRHLSDLGQIHRIMLTSRLTRSTTAAALKIADARVSSTKEQRVEAAV